MQLVFHHGLLATRGVFNSRQWAVGVRVYPLSMSVLGIPDVIALVIYVGLAYLIVRVGQCLRGGDKTSQSVRPEPESAARTRD